VVVLSIACRHLDVEACLAELRRNAGLRRLIGIEQESQVPHGWNLSRFLAVLGESPHRELLHEVFNTLVQELGRVVPDLGANTAGDATQLSGRIAEPSVAAAEAAAGLPQPRGGESRRVVRLQAALAGRCQTRSRIGLRSHRYQSRRWRNPMPYIGYEPDRAAIVDDGNLKGSRRFHA
jgi:hypothetical protein